MPRAPKVCSQPGCPVLVREGARCAAHPYEDTRPHSAGQRGYSSHWHQTSARYLRKHRTCVLCGAPSAVADHRIPRQVLIDRGVQHPDADVQLQALCRPCHAQKTGAETRARNEVRRRLSL